MRKIKKDYKIQFIEYPERFNSKEMSNIFGGKCAERCFINSYCNCKGKEKQSYTDQNGKEIDKKNTSENRGLKKLFKENIWVRGNNSFCFIVTTN